MSLTAKIVWPIMDRSSPFVLEAEAADLQRSIDRASLIINDKLKSPLRCKFEDGSLSITSPGAGSGRGTWGCSAPAAPAGRGPPSPRP